MEINTFLGKSLEEDDSVRHSETYCLNKMLDWKNVLEMQATIQQ